MVVAAPAYLARRGTPQRPGDLASHDIVVFGGLGAGQWDFGADGAVRLSPRLTVNTAEAAIDAVAAGAGLTRVLGYQAVDALRRGAVVQLLEAFGREESPVYLLYPAGAHPPPKLRAFVDFAAPKLRAQLAEIDEALD